MHRDGECARKSVEYFDLSLAVSVQYPVDITPKGVHTMIIRCARKVAEKIKVVLPAYSPEPLGSEWYTNLFRYRGQQFLLVTESKSLLSVVVRGRGITSRQPFLTAFRTAIEDYVRARRRGSVLGNQLSFQPGGAAFHTTNNRRVLGSMNDPI